MSLTEPQVKALDIIAFEPMTARQFGQAMWPDSPAHQRRTRKRLGRNGAVGGAMWLKAGTLLRRLERLGLANEDSGLWLASWKGLRAVEEAGALGRYWQGGKPR